jgi:hypothetical protein
MNAHAAAALLLVATSLVGCEDSSSLPGTSLGSFSVSGAITANTCGSALGASDPWTFDTKMSRDGSTLYWQPVGAATPRSGLLDTTNKASMTVTTTGQPDAGDLAELESRMLEAEPRRSCRRSRWVPEALVGGNPPTRSARLT